MTLRQVTPGDRDFLRDLYASIRQQELDQVSWGPGQREAFIDQQFTAQDREYRERYPSDAFMVIERDGDRIGRLYRWRVGTALRVIDIALVPTCRGKGIGTALIGALMTEASASGADVTLYVERFNPAFQLYMRLGFEPIEDGPVYSLLRWRPAAQDQLKTAS